MVSGFIISAFLIGIVSSAHCVGMCGPIAFALPVQTLDKRGKLTGLLLYNLGRISSYTAIGLIVGFIGREIFIAGYQQMFSIMAGVAMLLYALLILFNRNVLHLHIFNSFQIRLQQFIGMNLRKRNMFAAYLIGLANGILPCGMVYFAITGAMATGTVSNGMLFMFMFGLGTTPALLAFGYFGSFMQLSFRNKIKRLSPYFIAVMAVVFILRGMNLGIPYLSPLFHDHNSAVTCH